MDKKQRLDLPVGQWVPGYAMRNEFGEIQWKPSKVGSRAGKYRIIKETQEYTLGETESLLIIRQRLKKSKHGLELLKEFMKTVNMIMQDLREYEI